MSTEAVFGGLLTVHFLLTQNEKQANQSHIFPGSASQQTDEVEQGKAKSVSILIFCFFYSEQRSKDLKETLLLYLFLLTLWLTEFENGTNCRELFQIKE